MDIKRVEIAERDVTSSSREAMFWPELDGLRAEACALVVVAHFNPWIGNYNSPVLSPIKAIDPGQCHFSFRFGITPERSFFHFGGRSIR
jgi:peptidoglycan/LPS O-acetylase OafA/YrhL